MWPAVSSPGLLLQETQTYPGGKLLLGNEETVALKHVCCNLTVVKHQKKGEETSFSGEGATRVDTLSTRKCVMSGEFRLNHSEVGGNTKLSLIGEVTEICCLPGLEGTDCLMRGWAVGYVNRPVVGLSLPQQKLGLFISIVTLVPVFVVDGNKTEFGT